MRVGAICGMSVLSALALVLSCGSDGDSGGSGPADSAILAFISNRDGDPEVYVMNADGSNPRMVSEGAETNYSPAWKPDGTQIVFTSYAKVEIAPDEPCPQDELPPYPPEIYSIDPDGSNRVRLSRYALGESDCPTWSYMPTWSPDGSEIAFISSRSGAADIYIMNADGTGEVNVTNTPDVSEEYPAWSPDGTRIAFTSSEDGNPEIYVMQRDGTGRIRLTTDSATDERPAWSPDGTQIAFNSDRDGDQEIYVMAQDGTNQTRITDDPGRDYYSAWSPDGERISFTSNRGGDPQIYVMAADGSDEKAITSGSPDTWSSAASWKP